MRVDVWAEIAGFGKRKVSLSHGFLVHFLFFFHCCENKEESFHDSNIATYPV